MTENLAKDKEETKTKKCRKCEENKPLDDFGRNRGKCKPCRSEQNKIYYYCNKSTRWHYEKKGKVCASVN